MYNKFMRFEWDANKSASNKIKHEIDFEKAKNLWLEVKLYENKKIC